MVVNDVHVTHCIALGRPGELDIQLAFPGGFRVHREVGRLGQLNPWVMWGPA